MDESSEVDVGQMVQKFFAPKVGEHVSMGVSLRLVLRLVFAAAAIALDSGNGGFISIPSDFWILNCRKTSSA